MTRRRQPQFRAGLRAAAIALALILPANPAKGSQCDSTSKGFVPLNDLGAGTYQALYQGGLYPGGSNERPVDHLAKGLLEAEAITPRDTLGNPDAELGRIVLLSIGMCNTSSEFNVFTTLASTYPGRNQRVILLNGAQNSATAAVISDENAPFWAIIDGRLAAAHVTRKQVQVIWIKEANASPSEAFPAHANIMVGQFKTIMNILRSRYENVRICYFSSRIYAGYATTSLNPEPYAYEGGFAAKWLIEEQINGSPELNFDAELGPVRSPWLSWGPYLWADGTAPRSDGLTWACDDFQAVDGTHPSGSGRLKVAEMLLDFLTTDVTSTPWFFGAISGSGEATPPVVRVAAAQPNPFTGSTTVQVIVTRPCPVRVDVVAPSGRRLKSLFDGPLGVGAWDFAWDGTDSGGQAVGSGVYFLRVTGEDEMTRAVKVTLTR